MIVEEVTGNKIADEIRKRITVPLGLDSTYFAQDSNLPVGASHGYSDINNDGKLVDVTALDPSCAWAAGAIVTTLDDLGSFTRALAEGTLLSAAMQEARLTWVDHSKGGTVEAYGLGIAKLGDLIGHSGSIGGFESAAYYLPSAKVVLVVWVNDYPTNDAADTIARAEASMLFPSGTGP